MGVITPTHQTELNEAGPNVFPMAFRFKEK